MKRAGNPFSGSVLTTFRYIADELRGQLRDLIRPRMSRAGFKSTLIRYFESSPVVASDGDGAIYAVADSIEIKRGTWADSISVGFSLGRERLISRALSEVDPTEQRRPVAPNGFEEFYAYTFNSLQSIEGAKRGFEKFVDAMINSRSRAMRPRLRTTTPERIFTPVYASVPLPSGMEAVMKGRAYSGQVKLLGSSKNPKVFTEATHPTHVLYAKFPNASRWPAIGSYHDPSCVKVNRSYVREKLGLQPC